MKGNSPEGSNSIFGTLCTCGFFLVVAYLFHESSIIDGFSPEKAGLMEAASKVIYGLTLLCGAGQLLTNIILK